MVGCVLVSFAVYIIYNRDETIHDEDRARVSSFGYDRQTESTAATLLHAHDDDGNSYGLQYGSSLF